MESSNKFRVLIADQFSEEGMKELVQSGLDVKYVAGLNGESLTKALAEYHLKFWLFAQPKSQLQM